MVELCGCAHKYSSTIAGWEGRKATVRKDRFSTGAQELYRPSSWSILFVRATSFEVFPSRFPEQCTGLSGT